MIQLQLLQKDVKFPDGDYVFDKMEHFLPLLDVLTPKFSGRWSIVLVDIKLREVKQIVDSIMLPDYIDLTIMLSKAKLDAVTLDYPNLAPKAQSVKDTYLGMITNLKHLIDKKAMWNLYKAIGPHVGLLQEALDKLDAECAGTTITDKQVRQTYLVQHRVYASDVLIAFLRKDRYRWNKYTTLVNDLGEDYAYNALYKQARTLLLDKQKYLTNNDTKNRAVEDVDAPLICYTYVLFANSRSSKNLQGIMHCLDNRCEDSLERSINVNL